MRCTGCGIDNPDHARDCAGCGRPLSIACRACSFWQPAGAARCVRCGRAALETREVASVLAAADAEHRQITVLFCDVIGSSELAERLDPEDLREVLLEYQRRGSAQIERFGGYVAQLLGDGLLAYFGFPVAHEDDARRAILSGLSIVCALGERAADEHANAAYLQLQVRIGIHTGPVVIGEMGDDQRHELLAVGETPNVAARVQAFAQPNTVVVTEATRRLSEGYFRFAALGAPALKGFSQPLALHEAREPTTVRGRLDALGDRLTPFVGRDTELQALQQQWEAGLRGEGPIVLLGGEPGMGKSRLLRAFSLLIGAERHDRVECYCSPLLQSTALHPIVDLITRRLSFRSDETAEAKLTRLRAELAVAQLDVEQTLPLLAPLLSIPLPAESASVALGSPQKQRQAMLHALLAWLLSHARSQPVLLIFEDLHWADPSTLEFLGILLAAEAHPALMVVLTFRAEFRVPWRSSRLYELSLERLPGAASQQIVERLSQAHALPAEIVEQVLHKADGVPLYLEEITKAVLEAAERGAEAGGGQKLAIPASVQDSLTACLDRLSASKALIQLAATLGRTFRFEHLHSVADVNASALRAELERIAGVGLLFRHGKASEETYSFRHALIRDAAYASLLRTTRQGHHRRIARALCERFQQLAAEQPELIAQHCEGAGLNDEAADWFGRAGKRAASRSDYFEAISVCNKALELLASLPASVARDRREIELRACLGGALSSTQGFSASEVARNYGRAHELCFALGDVPLAVLHGIWTVYVVRNELAATSGLAATFERLRQSESNPLAQLVIHSALGTTAFFLGEYARAEPLLQHATELCDTRNPAQQLLALQREFGFEGYIHAFLYRAWCLAFRGHPRAGLRAWHEAHELAERLQHPQSLAMTLIYGAVLAVNVLRDPTRSGELAARSKEIAIDNRFGFWYAMAEINAGISDAQQGAVEQGIARIEAGTNLLQAVGAFSACPYGKRCLAEANVLRGDSARAIALADEGLAQADGQLARTHVPTLFKIRGDAFARRGENAQAKASYMSSLAAAQAHGGLLFELHAGVALARLLASEGDREQAHALLATTCARFPPGESCPDLELARELMTEFAGRESA